MAGCLTGVALAASAAPQAMGTTIGQLAPGSSPPAICGVGQADFFNSTVSKGDAYVVPPYGTAVTSWSTNAAAAAGQMLTLKVFREVTLDTYRVIAHDGPRSLTGGTINTFPVNIPVAPGDFVGVNNANGVAVPNACVFTDSGFVDPTDRYRGHIGDPADGDVNTYFQSGSIAHVNLKAVIKPVNTFALGALARNKKKGTATLTVEVPVPGTLGLSGTGVKSAAVAGARASQDVSAGATTLQIKAKGKARSKLTRTGKAKVNAVITYTPTDGDPNAQTLKVKLRKKLKRAGG
jgi:hypothetical protein